jgi:hypothetical protein
MDVRRLAAVDMWGTQGTMRRRRIILAEFIAGAIGITVVGTSIIVAAPGVALTVLGACIVCIGLNYAPLSGYAILLSQPGALEAELDGVDVPRELRRYGVLQLWLLVPLALVVFTARAVARPHP